MEEPQADRPEPHRRPSEPRSREKHGGTAVAAIVLGAVLVAGLLAVTAGRRHAGDNLREATAGAEADKSAPISAPAPASGPAPVPAPSPAAAAPSPAPALTPMEKFRRCKPYDQYLLDAKTPSFPESTVREEAACLCGLAGGYTVRVAGNGIRQFTAIAACPAGSSQMPLGPDAKQWKGEWIDEPGHKACVCSTSIRTLDPVVVAP